MHSSPFGRFKYILYFLVRNCTSSPTRHSAFVVALLAIAYVNDSQDELMLEGQTGVMHSEAHTEQRSGNHLLFRPLSNAFLV